MRSKLFLAMIFTLTSFAFNSEAFDAAEKFNSTCKACHTIGGGDRIGPDLKGVTKRRKMDWIIKFVQYPEGMIKGDPDEEGYEKPDPIAQGLFKKYKTLMTEQDLEDADIKTLMTWIDAQKEIVK